MPADFKYTRRCTHLHVSGRRCGGRAPKRDIYGDIVLFCQVHKGKAGNECPTCLAMMQAFVPKNGWERTL